MAEGQHSEVVDSSSRQEQEVGVVTAGEQEVGVDKETGQEVGVAIRVEDRTEEGEMGDTGGGRTDGEEGVRCLILRPSSIVQLISAAFGTFHVGKFMLWKMWCFALQSMGRTNHKFPIIHNMQCSVLEGKTWCEYK